MDLNKNITIITWVGSGNFGTALQSFALHKKIEALGCDVTLVPNRRQDSPFKLILPFITDKLGIQPILKWMGRRTKKYYKLCRFQSRNYNLKNIYFDFQFSALDRKTDVYISGSDQIWNTYYQYNPFFFLGFNTTKRKIAYGSSIGTKDFKPEYKDDIKNFLCRYDYIGLREQSAIDTVKRLTGRDDIVKVTDPTFLLNAEEWKAICTANAPINKDLSMAIGSSQYIFCYFIGDNEEYERQLNDIKQQIGVQKVVRIPSQENGVPKSGINESDIIYKDADPLEFVMLLSNATFVCTDSFHATALSINFGKQFSTFLRFAENDEHSQNNRIYDILNHYKLMERLYKQKGENIAWAESLIDYQEPHRILEKERSESISFLKQSILNSNDKL